MTCPTCKAGVKTGLYDTHQCTPQAQSVKEDELQVTSSIIQQLLSESPENVVEIPTRGTVSHLHNIMLYYQCVRIPVQKSKLEWVFNILKTKN